MPIRYIIQPEMDLLLYVFEGHVTAAEYFDMYYAVYKDADRHHGMKVLFDVFNCELDFGSTFLKDSVALMRGNREAAYPPDHVAVMTVASGLDYLTDAIKLLSDEMPVFMQVFYNFSDAVRWLGLGDREEEVREFWQAFKKKE
jgi:hypothetical protein